MIVQGIDPGIRRLGLAWLDWTPTRRVLLAVRTVKTKSDEPIQARIETLWNAMTEAPCDLIAMEEQDRAWSGMQERGLTNANAVKVRVVEGAIRTSAIVRKVPLIEVTPAQIRAALGLPVTASKKQIEELVRRLVVGVANEDLDEHSFDALAHAVTGGHRYSVLSRLARSAR